MDRPEREITKITANDIDRCAKDLDELAASIWFRKKLRWSIENRVYRLQDLADRLRQLTNGDSSND